MNHSPHATLTHRCQECGLFVVFGESQSAVPDRADGTTRHPCAEPCCPCIPIKRGQCLSSHSFVRRCQRVVPFTRTSCHQPQRCPREGWRGWHATTPVERTSRRHTRPSGKVPVGPTWVAASSSATRTLCASSPCARMPLRPSRGGWVGVESAAAVLSHTPQAHRARAWGGSIGVLLR
jgi:hypothetical protein